MSGKNSFILYTDYAKHLKRLSLEQKGKLLDALFLFAEKEEETDLEPVTDMAFSFIKEDMEINKRKWLETCQKRSEYGKLGGRPKKEENLKVISGSISFLEKAKKAENVNENVNDKENDNYNREFSKKTPIFKIPSVQEIKSYCSERKNNVNPEAFYNFYDSKGWMIGKNKMKDWKAAVRTWENNNRNSFSNQTLEERQEDGFNF